THFGRIKAHHGDRVRAHGSRILHHAVEGLTPRILVEFHVRPDLAAREAFEQSGDIASNAARPDSQPKYLAYGLYDPGVRDVLGRRHDHGHGGCDVLSRCSHSAFSCDLRCFHWAFLLLKPWVPDQAATYQSDITFWATCQGVLGCRGVGHPAAPR